MNKPNSIAVAAVVFGALLPSFGLASSRFREVVTKSTAQIKEVQKFSDPADDVLDVVTEYIQVPIQTEENRQCILESMDKIHKTTTLIAKIPVAMIKTPASRFAKALKQTKSKVDKLTNKAKTVANKAKSQERKISTYRNQFKKYSDSLQNAHDLMEAGMDAFDTFMAVLQFWAKVVTGGTELTNVIDKGVATAADTITRDIVLKMTELHLALKPADMAALDAKACSEKVMGTDFKKTIMAAASDSFKDTESVLNASKQALPRKSLKAGRFLTSFFNDLLVEGPEGAMTAAVMSVLTAAGNAAMAEGMDVVKNSGLFKVVKEVSGMPLSKKIKKACPGENAKLSCYQAVFLEEFNTAWTDALVKISSIIKDCADETMAESQGIMISKLKDIVNIEIDNGFAKKTRWLPSKRGFTHLRTVGEVPGSMAHKVAVCQEHCVWDAKCHAISMKRDSSVKCYLETSSSKSNDKPGCQCRSDSKCKDEGAEPWCYVESMGRCGDTRYGSSGDPWSRQACRPACKCKDGPISCKDEGSGAWCYVESMSSCPDTKKGSFPWSREACRKDYETFEKSFAALPNPDWTRTEDGFKDLRHWGVLPAKDGIAACKEKCLGDPKCHAITYKNSNKECWTETSTMKHSDKPGKKYTTLLKREGKKNAKMTLSFQQAKTKRKKLDKKRQQAKQMKLPSKDDVKQVLKQALEAGMSTGHKCMANRMTEELSYMAAKVAGANGGGWTSSKAGFKDLAKYGVLAGSDSLEKRALCKALCCLNTQCHAVTFNKSDDACTLERENDNKYDKPGNDHETLVKPKVFDEVNDRFRSTIMTELEDGLKRVQGAILDAVSETDAVAALMMALELYKAKNSAKGNGPGAAANEMIRVLLGDAVIEGYKNGMEAAAMKAVGTAFPLQECLTAADKIKDLPAQMELMKAKFGDNEKWKKWLITVATSALRKGVDAMMKEVLLQGQSGPIDLDNELRVVLDTGERILKYVEDTIALAEKAVAPLKTAQSKLEKPVKVTREFGDAISVVCDPMETATDTIDQFLGYLRDICPHKLADMACVSFPSQLTSLGAPDKICPGGALNLPEVCFDLIAFAEDPKFCFTIPDFCCGGSYGGGCKVKSRRLSALNATGNELLELDDESAGRRLFFGTVSSYTSSAASYAGSTVSSAASTVASALPDVCLSEFVSVGKTCFDLGKIEPILNAPVDLVMNALNVDALFDKFLDLLPLDAIKPPVDMDFPVDIQPPNFPELDITLFGFPKLAASGRALMGLNWMRNPFMIVQQEVAKLSVPKMVGSLVITVGKAPVDEYDVMDFASFQELVEKSFAEFSGIDQGLVSAEAASNDKNVFNVNYSIILEGTTKEYFEELLGKRCTFTAPITGSVAGHNLRCAKQPSLKHCEKACLGEPLCQSVDYNPTTKTCCLGDCRIDGPVVWPSCQCSSNSKCKDEGSGEWCYVDNEDSCADTKSGSRPWSRQACQTSCECRDGHSSCRDEGSGPWCYVKSMSSCQDTVQGDYPWSREACKLTCVNDHDEDYQYAACKSLQFTIADNGKDLDLGDVQVQRGAATQVEGQSVVFDPATYPADIKDKVAEANANIGKYKPTPPPRPAVADFAKRGMVSVFIVGLALTLTVFGNNGCQ